MPTISVIIPVYNGAKTIDRTINSVLLQTFSDFEIIVIDDGSIDETLEVVGRIGDLRIKVYSYSNTGVSAARNHGINHAQGEYVSFIDADDLWTGDKLAAQYQALQDHPQAQVAYSWTDWIDENDRLLRPAAHMSLEGNIYANLLIIDFMGCGSNPLIHKQALLTVGGFDPVLRGGEDWDLWIRLAAQYEFVCVRSPQVLYRQVQNSASKDLELMERDGSRVITKSFQQAPASLQYLRFYALGNFYKAMLYRSLATTLSRKEALESTKYLYRSIGNDPSFIKAKVTWKIIFLLCSTFLLPQSINQKLLDKFAFLKNVNAIHGYMQININKD